MRNIWRRTHRWRRNGESDRINPADRTIYEKMPCICARCMVNYKCCEEGWSSVTDVLRTSGAYQEENYERHHQRN